MPGVPRVHSGAPYERPHAPWAYPGHAPDNVWGGGASAPAVDASANPVVFTAGLPAIASLWAAFLQRGGADVLMASTAYGGSSQLADVVSTRAAKINKHNFHIQGTGTSMLASIERELDRLAGLGDALLPTTVLFTEIPTNPDMKVPDMAKLAELVQAYRSRTGKQVLLLVDATFAPGSNSPHGSAPVSEPNGDGRSSSVSIAALRRDSST